MTHNTAAQDRNAESAVSQLDILDAMLDGPLSMSDRTDAEYGCTDWDDSMSARAALGCTDLDDWEDAAEDAVDYALLRMVNTERAAHARAVVAQEAAERKAARVYVASLILGVLILGVLLAVIL